MSSYTHSILKNSEGEYSPKHKIIPVTKEQSVGLAVPAQLSAIEPGESSGNPKKFVSGILKNNNFKK